MHPDHGWLGSIIHCNITPAQVDLRGITPLALQEQLPGIHSSLKLREVTAHITCLCECFVHSHLCLIFPSTAGMIDRWVCLGPPFSMAWILWIPACTLLALGTRNGPWICLLLTADKYRISSVRCCSQLVAILE